MYIPILCPQGGVFFKVLKVLKVKNHNFILSTSLIFLSSLVILSCHRNPIESKQIQYVKTTVAESVGEESMVSYPGKTKASEVVSSSFKVSGTLSKVYVREGSYVKKGQLIAELDPHDYSVQLAATQAEYDQIKADADRIISMYNEGTATASSYDKARYGLQQISEKLAHHKDELSYCKLYSPIEGYVQRKLHDSGENVSAGMPIMTMFTSSGVEVEINISGSDYNRRSQMIRAICSFDILPDNIYGLDISRISKEANASQLYTMRLSFKRPSDTSRITPGMSTMVYVSYTRDGSSGRVRVPSSCIYHKKDKSLVYVYDKTRSIVSPRIVTVGFLDSRGYAELTSGLESGETVVSAGVRFLKPGQKVKEADKVTSSNVGQLL